MDQIILCRSRNSLSIRTLSVIFAMLCILPINSGQAQSWKVIEKELTQYTLSPTFERVIQQFVQEGEKTFYKDGPVLMSIDFDQYGIHISGDTIGQWVNLAMFSDNILGYFTVSEHDFIIYGQPKYIENICFKGTRKRNFELWEMLEIFFSDPNISYTIVRDKDGQFRITEKYYDPDVR